MTASTQTQGMSGRAALVAQIRTLFLSRLGQAVEAAGIPAAALEALRSAAAQSIDELTAESARSGFALANSLTASQIRLVDDNQLELSLRLGDLSRRLSDELWGASHRFHLRFITLIDRPVLRVADNPLAPEAICRALAEMFGVSEMTHQAALNSLAAIEAQLERELPLLYADINEILVLNGVEPARSQIVNTEVRPGAKRPEEGERPSGDAMAALQAAVLSRLQHDRRAPGGSVDPGALSLDGLDLAGSLSPRFEQIMLQLDRWQANDQADLFGQELRDQSAEPPLHSLKASEPMMRLRAQDTVALDVLAVVFDALFDDFHLSNAIKTAIARLQIPVLKAAIIGPTFFSDAEHPARVLLKDFAQATIGLDPQTGADHPVCAELQRVAIGIQTDFTRDVEVFSRYDAELQAFLARRNHDLQGRAQGYITLAKVQEKRDIAARIARHFVSSRTLALSSRLVADFLREHWTQVLAEDWLAGGEEGVAWKDDAAVLENLVWSLQPKADTEERTQLGQMVPALLRQLKMSLDRIGVTAESRAPFLDACFALQAAAIRGRGDALVQTQAMPPESGKDRIVMLTDGDFRLESLRPADPDARVLSDLVRELVIGDWVEFVMPDRSLRCGRLCWISSELGDPLFLNSAWDCAISVARPVLERQLASAEASTGSTLSFFDNAIEKALHDNLPSQA